MKCKCIPGYKYALVFRNYEMCHHHRHDGEEMRTHCQRLVFSHLRITLITEYIHSLHSLRPM